MESLLTGDGEFEQKVREGFHELHDEENPDTREIEPDSIDDFVEYIRTYGV